MVCAKSLSTERLDKLEYDIIEILCLLNNYFYPSFLDILFHLNVTWYESYSTMAQLHTNGCTLLTCELNFILYQAQKRNYSKLLVLLKNCVNFVGT